MYSRYMVQEVIWSNRHLVLNPKQGLALFLNKTDRDKGDGSGGQATPCDYPRPASRGYNGGKMARNHEYAPIAIAKGLQPLIIFQRGDLI
jgi:hypothetical protein